ncbi:MAG TPA: hypothetical protein PKE16_12520 [Hyphomicrobium sp.]|nr:hypothetical protein [Hyphomicrobium sp.]
MVSEPNADDKAPAFLSGHRTPSAPTDLPDPLTEAEGLDLVGILSSVEETAYVWDLTTGRDPRRQ